MKYLAAYIILFLTVSLQAADIHVGANKEYTDIRKAVEFSKNGDHIFIEPGTYNIFGLIIDKSIMITGIGFPVIDACNLGTGITISAPNVTIEGILVRNIPVSYMVDNAGIRVERTKNVTIRNNRLENSFFAIYLSNSDECTVTGNTIIGHSESESNSGNGIHLWKCNIIDIENNKVSGHRDGIYFEFVSNSRIINNLSENNLRYGLHFMFSEGNSYIRNIFRENGAGVAVMYTKRVEMIENTFENNWGPSAYGLLLKDISRSIIINNKFTKNTIGIYSEGSTEILIKNNSFSENGWAMKMLGNCTDDTIVNNDFYSNTFDVSTNSSVSRNYFDANYWDKYNGYDLNRDGVGDVSYRPVSLFSTLVEKTPEAILLVRSFLVDLIDLTEKIIPVFIPETLIDNHPGMKHFNSNNGKRI
ncbi:MAG: nitrous oxide reductase family maturation protein NosD [Ignavibacteria bacterium]